MPIYTKLKTKIITGLNIADLETNIDTFLVANSCMLNCKWIKSDYTQALIFYYELIDCSFANPILVLTFDNHTDTQFTNAYPILLAKGLKATFYISSSSVGVGNSMTWANIQTLFANGMDIQCHGKTHIRFTDLTEPELIAELTAVNAAFIANGLPVPIHNAYPFGEFNNNIIDIVKNYRLTGRGYGLGYPFYSYYKNLRRYGNREPSNSAMVGFFAYQTENISEYNTFMSYIDSAKNENCALFHLAHAMPLANVPYYEAMIDYAIAQGFTILCMSDFYPLLY